MHQRWEPVAWVPWTGPEDGGNACGTGTCGGLVSSSHASTQRSPTSNAEERGCRPPSSGHSQGSGKKAQTKPSLIAGMGRGETDHGTRGTGRQQKQQRLGQAGEGHKDGAQGRQGEVPGQRTEGRLGERQAASPGLSDQPSDENPAGF